MSLPYQHIQDQSEKNLLILILDKLCCISDKLVEQMTTAERDALVDPPLSKIIYNTTTNKLNVYTGSWEQITSA